MTTACEPKPDRAKTETRDAVEAAIEMRKEDRDSTWEQRAAESKRITRWIQQADAVRANQGNSESHS